jgi:hypothetical protein
MIYPDGSLVETIDGRQRYSGGARVCGWPGFSVTAQGRRLVALSVAALASQTGGSVFAPHVASAWQYMQEGDTAPLAWEAKPRVVHRRQALVRREGPWFAAVSGYHTPAAARSWTSYSRWIMIRSNCLSLWHEKTGVLIGGGHSKLAPAFCTFQVWEDGALRQEPDAVSFRRAGDTEHIRFRYGTHSCSMAVELRDEATAAITFSVPAATRRAADVSAGFTLRIVPQEKVRWYAGGSTPVKVKNIADPTRAMAVSWAAGGRYKDPAVETRRWRLEMPVESDFSYPNYPFNPYAIDDASSPGAAIGAVRTGFIEGSSRTFVLTVK